MIKKKGKKNTNEGIFFNSVFIHLKFRGKIFKIVIKIFKCRGLKEIRHIIFKKNDHSSYCCPNRHVQ